MIRVAIVDRCVVFAHGLAQILTSNGFSIVGLRRVTTGVPSWSADVVLLDPDSVEDMSLEEFVAANHQRTPVLLFGWSTKPDPFIRYAGTGIAGYIDRRTGVDELLTAIRSVADGSVLGPSPQSMPMLSCDETVPDPDTGLLSPREQQVLRLIAHGLTHGQVARRLGISPHTVDTYVKRIRSKLDLGNKAELTRAAMLGSYYSDEISARPIPAMIVAGQRGPAPVAVLADQASS